MNKSKDIDQYIANLTNEEDIKLAEHVRKIMFDNLPIGYEERYTYGMCGYYHVKPVIYFAIAKEHLGIYPTSTGITAAKEQGLLDGYSYSKGTIRIPKKDRNLDKLVKDIILIRVSQTQ